MQHRLSALDAVRPLGAVEESVVRWTAAGPDAGPVADTSILGSSGPQGYPSV